MADRFTRRQLLRRGAALGAGLTVAGAALAGPTGFAAALPAPARRSPRRRPGSLPDPSTPAGTEHLPEIGHLVVLMMENHSFDNYLGMLGRGDGFTLDAHGRPKDANPDGDGNLVRAFHMPNACQLEDRPGQDWNRSHVSYAGGRNDGFVEASGPVAMGYWTDTDIPFYYALAKTFPLCDRWFGSCLGQTYPNRRFLMAGTAYGLVSTDTGKILAPSSTLLNSPICGRSEK